MYPLIKKLHMCQSADCYSLISANGADREYDTVPIVIKGFLIGKTVVVINKAGQQVTSTQQFFVDEVDFLRIKEGDLFAFALHPDVKFPVITVEPFYKTYGILDYGVCYFR